MKVTYNWLKDFVEIKIPPQALADKLTMAGLEVVSLEKRDGDFVLEIEITSNRPDWLSVVGIAREVAAITNAKLKMSNTKHRTPNTKRGRYPLNIIIQDKKDCPLYTAKIIQGVKVGPSPEWMRKRLELLGCRSANNIVDITNYVLFERGEPLHAFDLDKLQGQEIVVRRGRSGEKITTIDGKERLLDEGILVIADSLRPVAIAGVIGGKNSEVTENTQNVLLEAAVFNPILIRRGRQVLGLQSESSYRFERGVDLETAQNAAWLAAALIETLGQGVLVLAKSSKAAAAKMKRVSLNALNTAKILGVGIKLSKIKSILNNLGFKVVAQAKNTLSVGIPANRSDVHLEVDLIEEVARIYGYENIPNTLPAIKPMLSESYLREVVGLVKNTLVSLGLNEVITSSLVDRNSLRDQENIFEIANPLSQDQAVLRPTLIPSLTRCITYNLNQRQNNIQIFELARIFQGSSSAPQEELILGLAMCGEKSWLLKQGLFKDQINILYLKGVIEALLARLGIEEYSFHPENNSITVQNVIIGAMVQLKDKNILAAQLSLEKLLPFIHLKRKFTPLPLYPGITRDISFIIKEGPRLKNILEAVTEKARPWLWEVKISDYYQGKQIPPGFRGLTISCLYRSIGRTLTEEEINPVHAAISSLLSEQFGVKIR